MPKCEAGNYSDLTMPHLFNLKDHNILWIAAKQKKIQFTECSSFMWLFFKDARGYVYNMKDYAIFLCVGWLTRATLLFQFKIHRGHKIVNNIQFI